MKDPVCGMEVSEPPKIKADWQGKLYGFCSSGCLAKFQGEPSRYLQSDYIQAMTPPNREGFIFLLVIFLVIIGSAFFKHSLRPEEGGLGLAHDFMAIFFIVFGSFKLLDWKGFADAYSTYDLFAKRSRTYSYLYPLIELSLGGCYLARWNIFWVNWITLTVMVIGSAGVAQALIQKKKIQCACLGTKIRLPMTKITLIEDLLMAGMALWAIAGF